MSELLYVVVIISWPLYLAAATNVIFMIFGRTDLRISLSRAKFDEQADFDVRLAVGRRKPRLLIEKQNF